MSKNVIILLSGILFAPVAIIFHECGHFAAALVLGLKPHLHFAKTTTQATQFLDRKDLLVTAAGPAVTALMAVGGLFSLWSLHRQQVRTPARWSIWLSTFFALCAGRWIRWWPGQSEQQVDEATLSVGFGFAPWVLPCLLAVAALIILFMTVRLHQPGQRLIPFISAILGLCLGCVLWIHVFGPRVLP